MKYLKKIASYPDGKKKVQEIAEAWRTPYKKKKAYDGRTGKGG